MDRTMRIRIAALTSAIGLAVVGTFVAGAMSSAANAATTSCVTLDTGNLDDHLGGYGAGLNAKTFNEVICINRTSNRGILIDWSWTWKSSVNPWGTGTFTRVGPPTTSSGFEIRLMGCGASNYVWRTNQSMVGVPVNSDSHTWTGAGPMQAEIWADGQAPYNFQTGYGYVSHVTSLTGQGYPSSRVFTACV